jgi:serine/threonine protein kinase
MIADFGQARMMDFGGTSRLPPLYPGGVPPEFFTSTVGTVETDIYHAGLTLYRLANGNPFFKSQEPGTSAEFKQATLDGTFPDRDEFLPHVPNALRAVIRRAMAVKASERYPSAADLQSAVAAVPETLDWRAELRPDGSATWTAPRLKQRGLIVRLERDGPKWCLQQFTDDGARPRRRNVAEWQSSLTRPQAMLELKRLFRSLG